MRDCGGIRAENAAAARKENKRMSEKATKAPLTEQFAEEARAMKTIADILQKLEDDEKARRVIGAVAVLHGFATAVWTK